MHQGSSGNSAAVGGSSYAFLQVSVLSAPSKAAQSPGPGPVRGALHGPAGRAGPPE